MQVAEDHPLHSKSIGREYVYLVHCVGPSAYGSNCPPHDSEPLSSNRVRRPIRHTVGSGGDGLAEPASVGDGWDRPGYAQSCPETFDPQLTAAGPSFPTEYHTRLLTSLIPEFENAPAQQRAEALENLDLTSTVSQLKSDHLVRQMRELALDDRKAILSGLMKMVNDLTDEEKLSLSDAIRNSNRSPGTWTSLATRIITSAFPLTLR